VNSQLQGLRVRQLLEVGRKTRIRLNFPTHCEVTYDCETEHCCFVYFNIFVFFKQKFNQLFKTYSQLNKITYRGRLHHSANVILSHVAQLCYSVIGDKPFLWSKPKFDPRSS